MSALHWSKRGKLKGGLIGDGQKRVKDWLNVL